MTLILAQMCRCRRTKVLPAINCMYELLKNCKHDQVSRDPSSQMLLTCQPQSHLEEQFKDCLGCSCLCHIDYNNFKYVLVLITDTSHIILKRSWQELGFGKIKILVWSAANWFYLNTADFWCLIDWIRWMEHVLPKSLFQL